MHLSRSKFNILASIEALYWAMVDSSHAALMAAGEIPPSPEHIAGMLEEQFVRKGLLKQKYSDWFKEMFGIAHYVSHGEVVDVSAKEIQMYRQRAEVFVNEMAALVKRLS